MTLTAVGSIAFDTVSTPFASGERLLGGSAVHFALASSFFAETSIVGPVGGDFEEHHLQMLRSRGVLTDEVQIDHAGRTFSWRGHYDYDLNTAHTDETQLGVFADFTPALSERARACEVLFLANIQPSLQRQVAQQCASAAFIALDSMNLWIQTARDELLSTIELVDCVLLNDAELRMLTNRPNLLAAAREVISLGPRVVIAKQGEYGAALFTEEDFFALPAFPLENVVDPTGAGDAFAGGFIGFIAAKSADVSHENLKRAMAYGTAIASFNVEELGTARLQRLTGEEIAERVAELRRITQFIEEPVELRSRPQA
jgi:sugar/nucleoside kinase (ribokinase family)